MKLTKLRTLIVVVLASVPILALIEYKFQVVAKVRREGLENVFDRIQKKLRREGVLGVWNTVVERLSGPSVDPDPSLRYSLYDKSSYPPLESAEARNALAEYKVIAGIDAVKLPPSRETGRSHDTWHRSHGDDSSGKYSSADQIDTRNVGKLEVAWIYSTGSVPGDATKPGWTVETNPVVADGKLFIASAEGDLISLDAVTGRELWRLNLPGPVARRGLIWQPNDDLAKSRLFVPAGNGVYAVNPANGQILRDFGNNGQVGDDVSLIAPVIVGDKLIVAMMKSTVEAYDLRSGKLLWTTSLLNKTDAKNTNLYGGAPWGGMSSDASRSAVYLSTGNPRPELIGTSRPGANRYSCSVVSINADTGEINWAFQEVSHDLWDLDIPSSPVLTTITRAGKRIDVVATVTKLGNTLLLDRDLGRPVFDYRLKRAPVSTIPGEQTAPYQPALELPQPFAKQVFEQTDLTDLSEAARQTVQHKLRGAKFGFFAPPIVGGKIVLFGLHGGAEWPGAAVDPGKGILYVPSNQVPWIIRAEYMDAKATAQLAETIPGNALYQANCAGCHGPERGGFHEIEYSGDAYLPALTGITLLRDKGTLTSRSEFDENHRRVKLGRETTAAELEILFEYFSSLDKIADRERSFSIRAYWQLLLDHQGYPGSKPPWGFLSAVDLNTGKRVWQVPLGEYEGLRRAGAPVKGQVNFGGVIATAGGLLFATGTVDNKIRAFDSASGRELWSFRLPAAGSAPPLTYLLNGTQYVVVVASGGMFHGFSGRSDKVIAFKLPAARR